MLRKKKCPLLSAAVTTICMPVVEALGVDKPSVAAWIVACIILGKLSKTGHLNKWVAPTLAIALGLADTFFTEAHYKLYGLDTMSPFSRMFAQLLGSCLLSGGTYVAVLAKGDSQEKAFGYAYAVIAAAALKAGLINAGEVGMGKAPFFVWGAIASYIAYKALDE